MSGAAHVEVDPSDVSPTQTIAEATRVVSFLAIGDRLLSDLAAELAGAEQAARHLHRANQYPGIHYYRWVVSHSLRQRPDGALVWSWHPSIKERRGPADVDWWAVLRAIQAPTLVLRGAESPILDRDVAERMARELPHGRFVEIPRAVHTLHEDNPEAVLDALREFLGF